MCVWPDLMSLLFLQESEVSEQIEEVACRYDDAKVILCSSTVIFLEWLPVLVLELWFSLECSSDHSLPSN